MAAALDTLLWREAGIFHVRIGDEAAMLNAATGRYHSLNDVGARIWELLEAPQTAAQLRDRLLKEFDIDAPECEAAVLDFVGQLLDRGILHAEP
jgi:hypothetical protein